VVGGDTKCHRSVINELASRSCGEGGRIESGTESGWRKKALREAQREEASMRTDAAKTPNRRLVKEHVGGSGEERRNAGVTHYS